MRAVVIIRTILHHVRARFIRLSWKSVMPSAPVLLSRFMLLLSLAVLASGCTALRPSTPPLVAVPTHIQGLDYQQIEELGIGEGACSELHQLHREQVPLTLRTLDPLVTECADQVAAARERRARDQALSVQLEEQQAIDALMASEWERIQAELERRRAEQLRRRQEAARMEQLIQAQQRAAQEAARQRAQLMVQIEQASIQRRLRNVADKPVAYKLNQPQGLMLKRLLACVELAYPNKGWDVEYSGRNLTVVARDARLPRGDLPVEFRFQENANYWRLHYLRVADIETRTDEDRYVLSQNLIADSCPMELDVP